MTPGALTFKPHLSGQPYLCLFLIFSFTQFKVVSGRESVEPDATLPAFGPFYAHLLENSPCASVYVSVISHIHVCGGARASVRRQIHTHSHPYTHEQPLTVRVTFHLLLNYKAMQYAVTKDS